MSKYYKYNPNGNKPKYVEMAEEEYIGAKQEDNRWFISFGNCVLECEKSEYDEHYRKLNHYRYTQKDAEGKTVETISLEQNEIEYSYDMSVFQNEDEVMVDDKIIESMNTAFRHEELRKAMERLSESERNLITQLFSENKNQSELTAIYGVSQQALSKRKYAILKKLYEAVKNSMW
ncbi:MAG: hypothetical protein NC177_15120 [Ruminococcus flavefaciens]|nr:hypothetical protein [Ruminococcus flavefaciens]